MAPAPNRLDSVNVQNSMSVPVNVTVVFDNHKDKVELQEEHEISPGCNYHFQEKILDMGSWTAIAPVKKVSVVHGNGSHYLEPSVSGVTKKIDVNVTSDGQLAIV
ncbi:hypothetical protein CEUSTIGMA_g12664.t1 [Chlamydomonas eustigma]|uniref:Uncharacterized protein n=1 Tax=Chlamydomonas eustigma TaxID=1157962 RepID=A0A250XQA6_9CHLO|nr:hypothetical protein CEUSTIGMA_g12444.t1 [Chlamydomonas eustigma]GAX85244.1 hypothetical protein CEUSTIGMA_g12664.t1 [Chlamydomonas eustigma]|eukprot:GAX85024.1 hypothetical protein CEUSTIGMA_g12444.t1 [Chlamydomonas eustigma]